ncbi:MAG: hypothetical protein ACE5JN_04610 [Candidatus Methylomirabilia bacterium]
MAGRLARFPLLAGVIRRDGPLAAIGEQQHGVQDKTQRRENR